MKLDHKREIATYRAKAGAFDIVDVAPAQFLMIDGAGDPNTAPEYADAVSALFTASYALKLLSKRELERDYTVMPLEALWWSDDWAAFAERRDKNRWQWTAMQFVPRWLDASHAAAAIEAAAAKGAVGALERLRLDTLDEGMSVQTLHVGPYDAEGPTIAAMHAAIAGHGLEPTGLHHEIYLGDPRRSAPEKLRTILRQPVAHPH